MKIAVPTNDKVNINTRTGQSAGFLVIEIKNGRMFCEEYRVNPPHENHGHNDIGEEEEHSHDELVENIKDCKAVIVNAVGRFMHRDLFDKNIEIFRTKQKNIDEAVKEYLANTN